MNIRNLPPAASFASPAIVGDELTDIVNETYTGLKEAYDAYFAG